MTAPTDRDLDSGQLCEKYGYWKDHPKYPSEDWRLEVDNRDTKESYWGWVYNMLQNEEPDA